MHLNILLREGTHRLYQTADGPMAQKRSRSLVLENVDVNGRHDTACNCTVIDSHITLIVLYGKMRKKTGGLMIMILLYY
jgi:hypothetical protein